MKNPDARFTRENPQSVRTDNYFLLKDPVQGRWTAGGCPSEFLAYKDSSELSQVWFYFQMKTLLVRLRIVANCIDSNEPT